jgi:hypothetical protein
VKSARIAQVRCRNSLQHRFRLLPRSGTETHGIPLPVEPRERQEIAIMGAERFDVGEKKGSAMRRKMRHVRACSQYAVGLW